MQIWEKIQAVVFLELGGGEARMSKKHWHGSVGDGRYRNRIWVNINIDDAPTFVDTRAIGIGGVIIRNNKGEFLRAMCKQAGERIMVT
uniref:Uncharacterized protein n=1 Tax=Daucus carota subsp. sativus TaxID=79200 RepID=A0A164Y7X4_DAUCS